MRRETLAHLLLLAVVLVWGATFVLVKDALTQVTPLAFVACRMGLAALLLAPFFARRLPGTPVRHLLLGALAGLWLALGYIFQTTGLRLTTPARSAFLTGAVVLLVPVLSLVPWVRAPGAGSPRPLAFAGAALGFAGLVMLTTPVGLGMGSAASLQLGRGEALTLLCALAFALHLLTLARASPHMHYGALALLQIGFAAVVSLLLLPVLEPHASLRFTPRVLVALGVAAALATAAAFAIQSWAQRFLPPTHTALILSLEPVFAALTSFVLTGERLGARGTVGAALILAGIVLAELAPAGIQPTAHEIAPDPTSSHPS